MGNGQRMMNLSLFGFADGSTGAQNGIFIYINKALYPTLFRHDVSILNVDITGFDNGLRSAEVTNYNITIRGNHFYSNAQEGFLGGGNKCDVSYNYFKDNGGVLFGSASSHAIYIATHASVTDMTVVGNYIEGYWKGKGDTSCSAGPLTFHAAITNLVVSGNTVIEDSNSKNTCWGLSANNITAAAYGSYLRGALFSDNIVVNGGSAALGVSSCPYCVIENNLIIADNPSANTGISAPPSAARASIANCTTSATNQCYDDPSTNYTVRNNTVLFTANANAGMTGIQVGIGGGELQAGHNVYNNTVSYLATTASWSSNGNIYQNPVYCFDYKVAASAYTLIDNNNCYIPYSANFTNGANNWNKTTSASLSTWRGAKRFDTHSLTSDPGFVLSAYPYFTGRTDNSVMYQLFNDGTNIFSPSAALSGKGMNGPLLDIAGASRSPTAPSIGAYE